MTSAETAGALGARPARRLVEEFGGRYSRALGVELDREADEVERWALGETGARTSPAVRWPKRAGCAPPQPGGHRRALG